MYEHIAFAVLWFILIFSVSYENIWKRIAILVLAFISAIAYGTFNYFDGYDNGYDRGQCSVVEGINRSIEGLDDPRVEDIKIQWEGCDE